MKKGTIATAPDKPAGERVSLFIGAWNDPEQIIIHGFATVWDALAFCICNGMDDPLPNTDGNKKYTLRPPKEESEQLKLF